MFGGGLGRSHELRGGAGEGGQHWGVWPQLEDLNHFLWVQGGQGSEVGLQPFEDITCLLCWVKALGDGGGEARSGVCVGCG